MSAWMAQAAVAAGAAAVAATSSRASAMATSLFYVPASAAVGGAAAAVLGATVEREWAGSEVAVVCAQLVPVLASTHALVTLRRLFGGSFAELQAAQRDTHRRFGQWLAAHLLVSAACVALACAAGRASLAPRALSSALLAVHAAAAAAAAARLQACRVADLSKLKEKLTEFQRRARQAAGACVLVHATLAFAVARAAEWRWSALWLGGAALQAWTVWTWTRKAAQAAQQD